MAEAKTQGKFAGLNEALAELKLSLIPPYDDDDDWGVYSGVGIISVFSSLNDVYSAIALITFLKNKEELIAIKKGSLKHSDCVSTLPIKDVSETIKLALNEEEDSLNKRVIANTFYWLDSHGDVHVKGTFTKSIKENVGKIFHFDNHNHSFAAKVGNVKSVKEVSIKWHDLGIDKEGKTICVIGESELIEDYNCQVFDAYKNNEITQHSVGMIYVKMDLAVNNPTETEYYKNWNDIYPLLGNQEDADSRGYFWVIREAKLKEYSCVLWDGSNSLTPTLENKTEAVDDTAEKEEAEKSLRKEQEKLLKELLNKF